MPHAISTATNSASNDSSLEIGKSLTESILTLQQTIRNIRDDVAAGIAPSIIIPSDSAADLNTGMLMLSLEPSTSEINANLTPLEIRLQNCISRLIEVQHYISPPVPPKSPEYSIIDLNDLSGAIKIIEDVIQHTWPSKPATAQSFFKQYKWDWDPIWKEFYSKTAPAPLHSQTSPSPPTNQHNMEAGPESESYIYLSLWYLDPQRQRWVHVNMNLLGVDVTPETAAEYIGTWEDWKFDSRWKEWCVDIRSEEDPEGRYMLYATPWHMNEAGEWVYG